MNESSFQQVYNVAYDLFELGMKRSDNFDIIYDEEVYQFTSQVTYAQCFDAIDICMMSNKTKISFDGSYQRDNGSTSTTLLTLISQKMVQDFKLARAGLDKFKEESLAQMKTQSLKEFVSLSYECCSFVLNQDKDQAKDHLDKMKKFVSTYFPDLGSNSKSFKSKPE